MVEMLELANILRNATPNSLVLLDEIGRGTSTFDGLALAWAVAEQLHAGKGVKTLFATHYHQLTDVSKILDKSVNCHMQAKEDGHELTLMHRVAEGPTDASFGIHVAKMAGMPQQVIRKANKILKKLEKHHSSEELTDSLKAAQNTKLTMANWKLNEQNTAYDHYRESNHHFDMN